MIALTVDYDHAENLTEWEESLIKVHGVVETLLENSSVDPNRANVRTYNDDAEIQLFWDRDDDDE
jgi:hypothetical protein